MGSAWTETDHSSGPGDQGRWERSDGAAVWVPWHLRYADRRWYAAGPDDEDALCDSRGHPRRWKTHQAAMRALDEPTRTWEPGADGQFHVSDDHALVLRAYPNSRLAWCAFSPLRDFLLHDRRGRVRRWKTAEAAMRLVDRQCPHSPPGTHAVAVLTPAPEEP